jgi:hypothetical protein
MPPPDMRLLTCTLGARQPSTEDVADRRLLEPAVAERPALGPVQKVFKRRNARPAAPAELLAAPAQVRPPDQTATLGIVEGRLQLARSEAGGDVEQRARRGGSGDALARLDVSRSEVKSSMEDARHCAGVPRASDRDLDLGVWWRGDVEPPQDGGGHVGGDGALAGRKHGGEYALLSGGGIRGVTHDAAANG